MSTPFTGIPVWRTVITGPGAGDLASPQSVTDMGVLLADRTQYLLANAAQVGYFRQPLSPIENLNARFTWDNGIGAWVQSSVADAGRLVFPVIVPPVGRIKRLRITRDGNGGGSSHSGLPATKPIYTLHFNNPITIDDGEIFDNVDPATTFAQYDTAAGVDFELLVGTQIQQTDYVYWLQITGEAGANSVANALAIFGLFIYVEPV